MFNSYALEFQTVVNELIHDGTSNCILIYHDHQPIIKVNKLPLTQADTRFTSADPVLVFIKRVYLAWKKTPLKLADDFALLIQPQVHLHIGLNVH